MSKPVDKLDLSVLMVIVVGTFMSILDGTIVNVALPKMIAVFGTSAQDAQWILTAYMLTMGVLMPASGFLGDRFGYKRLYIMALGFFVLGSAMCGLSWNVPSMVFSRVVQGLGGAIMQPVGMAILYMNYPREKMGAVLGVYGISIMAAPAIGPTLGGYLVDYVSWRVIFYLNLPVGLFCMFLAVTLLKETRLIKGKIFDYQGLIFSIVGFGCLLLALSEGNDKGWLSPYIVGLLFTALISLAYFVYHELQHPNPLLEMRLFKNGIFSLSIIIGALLSIGMFGTMFLFPILLQNILGQTAMHTGIIMFPGAIASGIMMPFAGKIFDRYGSRGLVMTGLSIIAFSTYMMTDFNAATLYIMMSFWLMIRGFGMGLCFMPVTTAGMNTVPQYLMGRASALSTVLRQVSSAFGIAIFAAIMQDRQSEHFINLATNANLSGSEWYNAQQVMLTVTTAWGMTTAQWQSFTFSMLGQQLVSLSMVKSIQDCLFWATIFCLIALPLGYLMGGKPAGPRSAESPPAEKAQQKDGIAPLPAAEF